MYDGHMQRAYIPKYLTGHYVENTGNTTLRFLEVFKSGTYIYIFLFFLDPTILMWCLF